MSSLALTSSWYYICTSYYTSDRYKFTKSRYDYRTRTGVTYEERGASMNIGKSKDNFNKDGKPRCFHYNIYKHIAKNCWKLKKKKVSKKILQV